VVEGETAMESTMLTSTTHPGPFGSSSETPIKDAEGSRAWDYLWAMTEMALRLLTNGRWGAPPAIWLALVCHMFLIRIRGILRVLGAVLPSSSQDWEPAAAGGQCCAVAVPRSLRWTRPL
jgi:hypothetical protein